MNDLQRIEMQILDLQSSLNLRPSLERAADLGDLLWEGKKHVQHGDFKPWVVRMGIKYRTGYDWMVLARERESGKMWPATSSTVTIKSFLEVVRRARRNQQRADRAQARLEASRVQGPLGDDIILAHSDCREYPWPSEIQIAVLDPPWNCLDSYRWAAGWAAEHLREGGLALVQAFQQNLPEVMEILSARLSYRWIMSFVYSFGAKPNGAFSSTWRPVLVYSRGRADIPEPVCDGYQMAGIGCDKRHHEWEQPAAPWRYWLGKLARPGALVADPYAGSAVIGVVCKELGLRYVGTEIDRAHSEVARGRLATQATL